MKITFLSKCSEQLFNTAMPWGRCQENVNFLLGQHLHHYCHCFLRIVLVILTNSSSSPLVPVVWNHMVLAQGAVTTALGALGCGVALLRSWV